MVPDLPKPMAPVGGRPFLALLIDHLCSQGITDIVVAAGYLHQAIVEHFGSHHGPAKLHYCIEHESLGTGGAIRQALAVTSADPVLVLNGDTLFRLDYRALLASHLRAGAQLTLALKLVADCSRYGRVLVHEGQVTAFQEKGASGPGLINGGTYLLRRNLFAPYPLPAAFSFERDFLQPFNAAITPHAYVADAYFIDIGVPEDYQRAQAELKRT